MKYYSTRDESLKISAAQAIAKGLASDGGLFVPEELPKLTLAEIAELINADNTARAKSIRSLVLEVFSAEDIEKFTAAAYGDNFDCEAVAPLSFIDDKTAFLELWHGPTCAFKDLALQLLPYLLTTSAKKVNNGKKAVILVATSGDTGKAALEGFKDVDGTKILVFYPKRTTIQHSQQINRSQIQNDTLVDELLPDNRVNRARKQIFKRTYQGDFQPVFEDRQTIRCNFSQELNHPVISDNPFKQ